VTKPDPTLVFLPTGRRVLTTLGIGLPFSTTILAASTLGTLLSVTVHCLDQLVCQQKNKGTLTQVTYCWATDMAIMVDPGSVNVTLPKILKAPLSSESLTPSTLLSLGNVAK
jgi:hypothetical protein